MQASEHQKAKSDYSDLGGWRSGAAQKEEKKGNSSDDSIQSINSRLT